MNSPTDISQKLMSTSICVLGVAIIFLISCVQAFVVAGPKASNSLPCNIGNSPSINSFTPASKTLFTVQC